TGPWTDAAGREPVDFPWERLDPSRRLVYASMGTLQNGILQTFRMMAEACTGLDLQLVISLGGGQDPALLGDLPGDPIVVGYAPQLDLSRRSALTISHGGLTRPWSRWQRASRWSSCRWPTTSRASGPESSGQAWAGRFGSGG